MKKQWLGLMLNLSGRIYRQKQRAIEAKSFETIWRSLYIVLLELALMVISLPTYLFVSGNKASVHHPENEAAKYHLRRNVTLTLLFVLLWALLLKFSIFSIVNPDRIGREELRFGEEIVLNEEGYPAVLVEDIEDEMLEPGVLGQIDWLTATLVFLILITAFALIRGKSGSKK